MKTALSLAFLFFSASVSAQPYIALGAAWSTATSNHANAQSRSDMFLMPSVGYRFMRNFAVEAAYFNPGEVLDSSTQTQPAPGQSAVTTRVSKLSGAKLSLVGSAPVWEGLSIVGSLSAYRLKGKTSEVDTLAIQSPPSIATTGERSSSGSGTTLGAGIGVSYAFTPAIEGRVMLDYMRGKDGLLGAGNDLKSLRTMSFSVGYSF